MSEDLAPGQPPPESRRQALAQYEQAERLVEMGEIAAALRLLVGACRDDPTVLVYRQKLRKYEKMQYPHNRGRNWLVWLTTHFPRRRMRAARRARDYADILKHGEEVLLRNPWDAVVQAEMAEAAERLGLLDLAAWLLYEARETDPNDQSLNRSLARLCERNRTLRRGLRLWNLVSQADPSDLEARAKREPERSRRAASIGPAPAPTDPEEQACVEWIRAHPDKAEGYARLARYYRRVGRLHEARSAVAEGMRVAGNQFELAAEQTELEIEPFRRDLEIAAGRLRARPDDLELKRCHDALLKEVNTRELMLYSRIADRFPQEKVHHLELGIRLRRAGLLDEADRELQVARTDPAHAWKALLHLGYCAEQRGDRRAAMQHFEEALGCLPEGETDARTELRAKLDGPEPGTEDHQS